LLKNDGHGAVFTSFHKTRLGPLLVSDLDQGLLWRFVDKPVERLGHKPRAQKFLPTTHHDLVSLRIDGDDVEGVGGTNPKASSLPDGVMEDSPVPAKDLSVPCDDIPWPFFPQVAQKELPVVPPGNETEVLTLGFLGDGEGRFPGNLPDLFLGVVSEGEKEERECLFGDGGEKVRLVLFAVFGPADDVPPVLLLKEGVVAGSEEIAP